MPQKLLSRDEIIVRHMRTHIKSILGNIFIAVLLVALGIISSVLLPADWAPASHIVTWSVVVILLFPSFILPFVRWATSTYTITTKRVITRHGILTKRGHDLPLSRISNVTHESSLSDRFFGCGTLTLETSSNDPLTLTDIPKIHTVQVEITDLIFNDVQGAVDADPTDTPQALHTGTPQGPSQPPTNNSPA